jgi:hypothetical protein
LHSGFPEIVGVGLRGLSLSSSGAHGFGEHRARRLLRATLDVRAGGIHAISTVIPTRLRRTSRYNDQDGEMTQFDIGHQNLIEQVAELLVRRADDMVAPGDAAPDATIIGLG